VAGEPAKTPPAGVLVPSFAANTATVLQGPEPASGGGPEVGGAAGSMECVSAVVEVLQVAPQPHVACAAGSSSAACRLRCGLGCGAAHLSPAAAALLST